MGNGNGETAAVHPAEAVAGPRAAVADQPARTDSPAVPSTQDGPAAPAAEQGAAAGAHPSASEVIARRAAANQVAADKEAARQAPVMAHLLRMADAYAAANKLRMAAEAYFEILQRAGDTPVGECARQRLMAIAENYERENKFHQARSLYERLL